VESIENLGGETLQRIEQLDAVAALDTPDVCISTDPPYYDNIGYADLSDFFYVWLRRSLVGVYPSLFATLLTPKTQELIASPYRHDGSKDKAQAFFEDGLGKAFARMQQVQNADYPLTVYYAFKQAESDEDDAEGEPGSVVPATASTGWETMLAGLIRAGFSIHGTWPMRTERSVRSVGLGTNALASSIVLVCRPRPKDAQLATRKQFIIALRRELPEALRNLQHGNIAPVDLAQAAIGPGMAVFTRYTKVMETDGSPMNVRTALGLINQALDEVLAEQEGEFDADTRWATAWFEQHAHNDGPYGEAETLSKAKNVGIAGLVTAGILQSRAGKVRLLRRDELPDDWDPAADDRLTVWEATQHLIRALDQEGESGAAALLHRLSGLGETARDLAYRLYTLCERKKWADEALAYNGLVIAWPELTKLALAERTKSPAAQPELF
jgi:putative DNA methylase